MNKNEIGIFDSGIGGITILNELKKILPNENFIYYADSKNNPYGNKSLNELFKIVCDIVDKLLKRNVKLIVIACNTATTRCINMLREKYKNVIFVGTEPAIKVACDKNFKNTIVMATPGTINTERMHQLVDNNIKDNQNVYLIPCEGLADTIEFKTEKEVEIKVNELLTPYKDKDIDSIVLGCTHYPYAKKFIKNIFPNATLIDGNHAVSKQVKRMLKEHDLLNNSNKKGNVQIIFNK